MKKGFTLIELLGVILIIGLMALIIYPNVAKYLKKGTKQADCEAYDNIVMAAKKCIADKADGCKFSSDTININLNSLVNGEYIKDPKIPSNNEDIISIELNVTREKSDYRNVYNYNYLHVNGSEENVLQTCE